MKNAFIIIAAIYMSTISCSKQEQTNFTLPEYEEFSFFENSRIDTILDIHRIRLVPSQLGSNIVFKHIFRSENEVAIADDEFEREIFFEIPDSISEFSFEDNLTENSNIQYRTNCFGCINEYINLENGNIRGEKQDNNIWRITIETIVQHERALDTISINEIYFRAN